VTSRDRTDGHERHACLVAINESSWNLTLDNATE